MTNHAAFIWSVADLLRGDYKQSEYGRVILPFTVLRRLDCVLDPVKADMLAKYESVKGRVENFRAGPRRAHRHRRALEHVTLRPAEAVERPRQPGRQPARPTSTASPRKPRRSSTSSTSPPRSAASTRPSCSTWSCPGSPRSTCTPTRSRTSRWATSMRN
ncbi:MAG: type I restriction-modification system subunit M N-terminal domain-containing protein [Acidimicrobiia bacterium]|nr:type I restriction-modification system subunit M N-terminal domain-containing protein [Acidimicrobiia bacterium]